MAGIRDIKRQARSTKDDEFFVERIRELLEYDPATGELFWKRRPAGTINSEGYVQLAVDGRHLTGHRAAFAIMTGRLPKDEVDHKNRKRADNRWENLREATRSQNGKNTGIYSTNTSGFKGVSWHKKNKKWCARIEVDGVRHHLGYFAEIEKAAQAYDAARIEYFGEPL